MSLNIYHRDTDAKRTEYKELKKTPYPLCLRGFGFFGLGRILTVLVLLLTVFALPVVAQNPVDADVDFYAQPPEDGEPFTIGDHITLRLEVTHPAGSQVSLPQIDPEWGNFEVVDQSGPETIENGDGTAVTGKNIVVSLFEPGEYQTPPLLVTHQKLDGTIEELGSPVIPLRITSILVEGDDQLRDLKEQAEMPVPPLWPFILAGLVLATVISGGLFFAGRWAYHRWWPKPVMAEAPQPVFVDTRPPEVIAYAELNRIEALNLPAQSQFKDHYSLVTDCLRQYIEGRYKIPALEQTTNEIQTAFSHLNVSPTDVRGFINLFFTSDLVKFARFKPNSNDAYNLVAEARYIVEITTPSPELENSPVEEELPSQPEVMS